MALNILLHSVRLGLMYSALPVMLEECFNINPLLKTRQPLCFRRPFPKMSPLLKWVFMCLSLLLWGIWTPLCTVLLWMNLIVMNVTCSKKYLVVF